MKYFAIFSLLNLIISQAFTQNYECVKIDATYYYTDADFTFTGAQTYHAIRIDSLEVNGTTTTYYNFPVIGIENGQYECYSGDWPSWIGSRIKVEDDGTTTFYNFEDKPIIIKSHFDTGQSWICYEFYTGYYIRAYIDSMEEMTFLGLTDMVKKITFQVMDSMGNLYPHPVNYMYLLLSQNHGLIRTINFKVFPDFQDNFWGDECHEYILCGISDPEVGIQNLTMDQIFDFEIGDEFHLSDHTWVGWDTDHFDFIKIVLDKEINGSEFTYTFARCGRKEHWDSYYNTHFVWSVQDTITETISPIYTNYSTFDALPDEYIAFGDTLYYEYAWATQHLNPDFNRMQKTIYEGYYSSYPHDCIEQIITDKSEFWDEHFYEGLGGPYWEQITYWSSHRKIIYFKKGDDEWGEPFDCDSLLVNTQPINKQKFGITIAPNPMKDFTRINVAISGQQNVKIAIYNSMGEKVRENLITNELILQKEGLHPGIYLIRVFESNKLIGTKKLVIK